MVEQPQPPPLRSIVSGFQVRLLREIVRSKGGADAAETTARMEGPVECNALTA